MQRGRREGVPSAHFFFVVVVSAGSGCGSAAAETAATAVRGCSSKQASRGDAHECTMTCAKTPTA